MNKGKVNFDQFSRAIEKIGVAMNEYVSVISVFINLFNIRTSNSYSISTTSQATANLTSKNFQSCFHKMKMVPLQ